MKSPTQPQTFAISCLQLHSSSEHTRDLQQQPKCLRVFLNIT